MIEAKILIGVMRRCERELNQHRRYADGGTQVRAAVSFVGKPVQEQDCSGVRRLLHHLLSGKMSKKTGRGCCMESRRRMHSK